jgi:hypothetical protein
LIATAGWDPKVVLIAPPMKIHEAFVAANPEARLAGAMTLLYKPPSFVGV